jgi:hypothetical protein
MQGAQDYIEIKKENDGEDDEEIIRNYNLWAVLLTKCCDGCLL